MGPRLEVEILHKSRRWRRKSRGCREVEDLATKRQKKPQIVISYVEYESSSVPELNPATLSKMRQICGIRFDSIPHNVPTV